uniref:HSF-type DNA-binding domain-containing protein n=1 Tax=Spumella elongata TaxID=89044 RepID=A0A7S3H7N4_9STRA|mmetsp:Transcript_38930/g.67374  ORF Transcript_38930/g.67374 Transcript_38930/m.67374 type:complete len:527 (+) Transcript_38930:83-1663(+)
MAVPQSFPAKIYQILENESPDIIQWNENGVSFRIVDHGRFEREIVPKYFRHNQISSVQRQLNLYGFKCISRGEFKRSFFHPKFRRGDWETVRKLTRYAPVKKNAPTPGEGMFSSPPTESGSISDEKKREERPMHPSMYNSYFHSIPGGNLGMNGGQADAASFNRNYMMPGMPPSNNAWLESWDRQENANSLNARMMGMPPHFAYAMMPMHAAAAMHHMNAAQGHRMPLPTGLPPSVSSSNLARMDSARQSDLSNRLGFKFGPDGSVLSSENGMAQGEMGSSTSTSSENPELAQHNNNNNQEQFQAHESRLVPSSSHHAFHSGHQGQGQSNDYDFMMELGMFDGMPPADLYHAAHAHVQNSALATSSSTNNSHSNASVNVAGAGHAFQQVGHNVQAMRLPTLTHELPALMMMTAPHEQHSVLMAAATALRASSPVGKPAVASHSHAALEITAHTPLAEENEHAGSECAEDGHTEKEQPLTTSAGAVTVSVLPAAAVTKGAAVDMACNTMLTYSKIHDALVYYRISDV